MAGRREARAAGEVIDAGLRLLDHQIVDRAGRLAGKVDDLELTVPDDGGPPVVSAILAGPGALSWRLGGRLGAWLESVHARLHPSATPAPARISFGAVKSAHIVVDLVVDKADLEVDRFEAWVRDHVTSKIPGAARETE